MEERILVLAPRGRDAQVIEQLTSAEGLMASICADATALVQGLADGASTAMITVEALDSATLALITQWLDQQPVWSDFPFIVLTSRQSVNNSGAVQNVIRALGNVLLVERPVKSETLKSTIHSAMRARRRQYETRSHLAERDQTTLMLAETDRRKDQFLAMLAHELRNPLTPIRSAGEVLKRSESAQLPTVRWASQIIERQCRQLSSLLEDLLDISRITTGKINLHLTEIELNLFVARAIETAQTAMDARQHTLTASYPGRAVIVCADPVRFAQVLSNLLDNAAKYTPIGGHIHVELKVENGEAAVLVRDDGIGISQEDLPHIFEIFSQAERGLDRAQGGLGIGLSLVRSIMEMHGGTITAQSKGQGYGTTMRAALAELRGHATLSSDIPEVTHEKRKTPLRVLIVDDNVDAAQSLGMLLDLEGYEVDTAADGPSGLNRFSTEQPDVVLLDIGLPGLDGYEVMRQIRGLPGVKQPTAIAITGYGQQEDIDRSLKAGFDHHMVKPLEIDVLTSMLAGLPQKRNA